MTARCATLSHVVGGFAKNCALTAMVPDSHPSPVHPVLVSGNLDHYCCVKEFFLNGQCDVSAGCSCWLTQMSAIGRLKMEWTGLERE